MSDEKNFYDKQVEMGLRDWLMMNGYVWSVGPQGQHLWTRVEGGEPDWDAIYDEVWAEDDITGNGPYGYPYEDDGALFSAVRRIEFGRFREIVENFGIDVTAELKRFTSWREVAKWADCLARLDALDRAIWAVQGNA